ncbi:zinc metallopeptidase [Anaerolineales bacterium]
MNFNMDYVLLIMIPGLLLGLLAQGMLQSTYGKWVKVRNTANVTGVDTANRIMQNTDLRVTLESTPSPLGDHFDSNSQVVRLSADVANQPSVASMAIAAHEFGHVQQYAQGSPLIAARNLLIPAVRVGPQLSYILLLIGFVLNFTPLIWLGVLFFGAVVLFSVVTLPVELDASRRGMILLEETGLMVTDEERDGVRAVLRAAAMTYVAAAITSLLQLVYYFLRASGSRRSSR